MRRKRGLKMEINGLPLNIVTFIIGMVCGMLFELAIVIVSKWVGGE